MVVSFGTSASAWTTMSGWGTLENTTGSSYANGSLLTHYNRLFGVFLAGSTHVKAQFELRIDTITDWCVAKFVRPFFTQITKERYDYLRTLTTFTASRDELTPWDAGKSADTYSVIQQRFYTNGTHSTYGVTADVNGRISGFGFQADRGMTVFKVLADYFYISSPTNDSKPFYVDATNNAVYIQNAFIKDGSITTAKIGNAAITTAKIDNAAITTAKIGDLQVDTINIKDGAVVTASTSYSASHGYEERSTLRTGEGMAGAVAFLPYPGIYGVSVTGYDTKVNTYSSRIYWDICRHQFTTSQANTQGLIIFNPMARSQAVWSVMLKVFVVQGEYGLHQGAWDWLAVIKDYSGTDFRTVNDAIMNQAHAQRDWTGNVSPRGLTFGSVFQMRGSIGLTTKIWKVAEVATFTFPGMFVDIPASNDGSGGGRGLVNNANGPLMVNFVFPWISTYRIHAYVKLDPSESWSYLPWSGTNAAVRTFPNDTSITVELFKK